MNEQQIRMAAEMAANAVLAQAVSQNVQDAIVVAQRIKDALEFYNKAHPL